MKKRNARTFPSVWPATIAVPLVNQSATIAGRAENISRKQSHLNIGTNGFELDAINAPFEVLASVLIQQVRIRRGDTGFSGLLRVQTKARADRTPRFDPERTRSRGNLRLSAAPSAIFSSCDHVPLRLRFKRRATASCRYVVSVAGTGIARS